MKRIVTGTLAAFALAAGITAATAGSAAASTVGDACAGYQIGSTASDSATGSTIICDSNYTWEPYVGQTPSDPWVDAQRAD